MGIEDLLAAEITSYNNAKSEAAKLSHISTIIQLKARSTGHKIYSDIKLHINHAIKCTDIAEFEYDKLNRRTLEKLISYLNRKQRVDICAYLTRKLKSSNLLEDEQWAQSLFKKHELLYHLLDGWKCNQFFSNAGKVTLCLTSYNLFSLFIGFVVSYITVIIVLLPAPAQIMAIFDVKLHKYSDNFIYNHAVNVLSLFLGLKNDLEIKPINPQGFFVIAAAKLFTLIIVANFVMKQFEKRMNK